MQKIEDTTPQDEKDFPRVPKLTSKLQINDVCCLNFGEAGIVSNCEIAAVKFVGNNVRYDVEVQCLGDPWYGTTTLRDVDSTFVEKKERYER